MSVTALNFVIIGQTVAEILRFYGFPKWRPPPSWIFKNSNSQRLVRLRDQICVIVLNFINIGQSVAEIWRFFYFQDDGRPPCWIFKIAILNVFGRNECQCASPYQISSKSVKWLRRYCDFTVFQNGGRLHLGFSKIQILNGWYACEAKSATLC